MTLLNLFNVVMAVGSECLGLTSLRLLQSHNPSGEPHCIAQVMTPRSSGEHLVNEAKPHA
jgi:hypothetical protein